MMDTERISELTMKIAFDAIENLMLIGLSQDEVSDVLIAAGKLHSINISVQITSDISIGSVQDTSGKFGKWDLIHDMEKQPFLKKLKVLQKKSDSIGWVIDEKAATKILAIVSEAVPLRLAMINWCKENRQNYQIEVVESKEVWMEQASDDEILDDNNVLFLDEDIPYSHLVDSSFLVRLREYAIREGRPEILEKLKLELSGKELFLSEAQVDLKNAIELDLSAAGQLEVFKEYLLQMPIGEEKFHSIVVDEFFGRSDVTVPQKYVKNWIEKFHNAGYIKKYKEKSRWKVKRIDSNESGPKIAGIQQ